MRSEPIEPSTEPRSKRVGARSTTSTVSSKSRRKTKAAHGKSVKASAPTSRRSPSPSHTVSCERDRAVVLEACLDVDTPGVSTVAEPPVNSSTHSLPDKPVSPNGPGAPSTLDIPLDIALNHPDPIPIISLSLAGRHTIANSELLTHHERTMSLEQWIRQEINLSYGKLLTDGQRQIDLFKTKAAELRKCIDGL